MIITSPSMAQSVSGVKIPVQWLKGFNLPDLRCQPYDYQMFLSVLEPSFAATRPGLPIWPGKTL